MVERIERVVVVDGGTAETSLPCPRCSIALFEGQAGGASLFGCGSCGGIWMDNATSQRVVSAVEEAILTLAVRATHAAKAPVETARVAACPMCKKEMVCASAGGVALDVCSAHGTWFDRGEVQRVSAHFQSRRVASAGGPTYDYASAAAAAQDRELYARGAMGLFGAILAGVAEAAIGAPKSGTAQ